MHKENPDLTSIEIMNNVSRKWKKISTEEKLVYE
jgi:hypothetical protein